MQLINTMETKQPLSLLSASFNRASLLVKQTEGAIFPLFILVWLAVWAVGYIVEYVNHASVWFPAAGLTFAGLLVVGARIIPSLTICAVLSTLCTGYFYQLNHTDSELLGAGLVFALTHIFPYYLASRVLIRINLSNASQPTLMLSYLVITLIASFITAFTVTYGLVQTNMMTMQELSQAWLPFWVGDMAGLIAVGPLFVACLNRFYAPSKFEIGELKEISMPKGPTRYILKLLLCALMLIAIMLLTYYLPSQQSSFAIFLMILPLMWISYTETPAATAISIAFFSFTIAFLVNLLGLMDYVLVYQFAICIVAASTFFYLSIPSLLAYNQQLKHKVTKDHLTGAASRSYLIEQAQIEIERAKVSALPLSLVVFDLDYFKQINDKLGHSQGDKALITVAEVAAACIRKTDLLSRHGGDEFVILLPNTTITEAKDVANKILQKIAMTQFDTSTHFTCSFGISQFQADDHFDSLFERADKALYKAKENGRNQVQLELKRTA